MSEDLTRFLERWREGDREAAAELMGHVYHQLHGMARAALRNERPGHTLQSTDLVHEAYMRLVQMDNIRWENRAQFFSIASQVLRHILVDYARERRTQKRGANAVRIPLEEALMISSAAEYDFEALDLALDRLTEHDARKAKVVELRYFAGLSIEEVAEVMECSPMTVKRDWNFAKAWLYRELKA